MSYQEKTVRELISDKREIQERLSEAATEAEKSQVQEEMKSLDVVLAAKLENRFWQAQNRDWKS